MTVPKILKLIAAAHFLLPLASCVTDDPLQDCSGEKCDTFASFDEAIDGREDPIANFLRTLDVDKQGRVVADFGTFVQGIAKMQGCPKESWRSFIVSDSLVQKSEAFPRVVSTVCDSPSKASEFFIAASFKLSTAQDIDPMRLEMFAWDAKTSQYRFYKSDQVDGQRIKINPNPTECAGCHLTPSDLPSDSMRMTPIMNELTRPWSHWNSEEPMFSDSGSPFPSHDFQVPMAVRDAPNFVRYARDHAAAAQELEAIIREGHGRAVGARARDKRIKTDDWRPAMNLLRPLFCEEQLNYATEDFRSGEIKVNAFIPGGLHQAFRAERPDNWRWNWLNNDDGRIRLPAPNNEEPLSMLPMRGNADIEFENSLMIPKASAVFSPQEILQIRALDWKRPVLSDFRCGLWKDALDRFEAEPPTIAASGSVKESMRKLYPQIMVLDGVAIDSGESSTFVSLAMADQDSIKALRSDLSAGSLAASCESESDSCSVDLEAFGAMVDVYVRSFLDANPDELRRSLKSIRQERLCHVETFFGAVPGTPGKPCED